jgi:hypothetical protein
MDRIKSIAEEISFMIMLDHGYDPNNFYQKADFNFNDPDSQIAMTHETVLSTMHRLRDVNHLSSSLLQGDTQLIPDHSDMTGVTSAARFSVMLGEGSTFLELKDFVSHLERMGMDDYAPVSGSMIVNIDVDTPRISRIECGKCGYMDYLVEPGSHDSSLEY